MPGGLYIRDRVSHALELSAHIAQVVALPPLSATPLLLLLLLPLPPRFPLPSRFPLPLLLLRCVGDAPSCGLALHTELLRCVKIAALPPTRGSMVPILDHDAHVVVIMSSLVPRVPSIAAVAAVAIAVTICPTIAARPTLLAFYATLAALAVTMPRAVIAAVR